MLQGSDTGTGGLKMVSVAYHRLTRFNGDNLNTILEAILMLFEHFSLKKILGL